MFFIITWEMFFIITRQMFVIITWRTACSPLHADKIIPTDELNDSMEFIEWQQLVKIMKLILPKMFSKKSVL